MTLGNRRLSTPRRMTPPVIDLTVSPSPGSPSEDPLLLVCGATHTGKRKWDGASASGLTASLSNEIDSPLRASTPPTKIPKQEYMSPAFVRPRYSKAHSPYPLIPANQDEGDSFERETHSDSGDSEQYDADAGYLDEDYGFIGDVFEVPTQRGSPSPETLYERSFTKLGQRKPTPRRLVLEGEGDLSAMVKTVYYEHDEDQVEAPSPSPSSRRRNRAPVAVDTAAGDSPRPYSRILDGLEDDAQEQEGNDDQQLSVDETDPDKSGYVHDPTGFEVLEEETPDNSQEHEEEALGHEEGIRHRESRSIPLPPPSTPPFANDQLENQDFAKEEGDDDPWGNSLDERQPELEPTITIRFDPSQEPLAGQTRFGRGLGDRFRENQILFSSSPIQSVTTQHDSPSTDRIQVEQSVAYDLLEDDKALDSALLQGQRLDDGCEIDQVPLKEYPQEPRRALSSSFPSSPPPTLQHRNPGPSIKRIPLSSSRSPLHQPAFAGEVGHTESSRDEAYTVLTAGAVEDPKTRIEDEEIEPRDQTEGEGEYEEDSPIIEVSSLDPKAAARAAVILKMVCDDRRHFPGYRMSDPPNSIMTIF